MGKDSLLQSTVNDKTKKKKSAPKQTAKTKKAAAKTKAVKPDTPKKQTVAPKKPAKKKIAPKKTTPKAPAVKAKTTRQAKSTKATPKTEKGAAKNLHLKRFDPWKPKKLYQAPPDAQKIQVGDAPPFVSGKNPEETKRIRALLFKRFELGPQSPSAETTAETPAGKASNQFPPLHRPVVKERDPAAKMMMYLVVGFIILVFLIIAASSTNRSNYYLKNVGGAIEVWQGTFAPLGAERIIILPGIQAPEIIKSVYTQAEVYELVCNYYLEKADTLIEVPDMPDFEGIKLYLNMAQVYAHTEPLKSAVNSRLTNIDLMTYLYKADVAASKGSVGDLQAALVLLNKAAALQLQANQAELVQSKIIAIRDLIAARNAQQEEAVDKSPKPVEKEGVKPTEVEPK